VGYKYSYASAPWCATDTDAKDNMVDGAWGFCSKTCKEEKTNNCYVDQGSSMTGSSQRCIFPFIFGGLKRKQCTYHQGHLKCPIKVDEEGFAVEKDLRLCGPSETCFNRTSINGKPITVGWVDVGSYANSGSKPLEISFSFETGCEDSSEKNWNVEASVTAGFSAFGAELEASVTAGGGGGSSSVSSQHQAHALTYNCPPHTHVVLSQQVMSSGVFTARTMKLILSEFKIGEERSLNKPHSVKELNWNELDLKTTSL